MDGTFNARKAKVESEVGLYFGAEEYTRLCVFGEIRARIWCTSGKVTKEEVGGIIKWQNNQNIFNFIPFIVCGLSIFVAAPFTVDFYQSFFTFEVSSRLTTLPTFLNLALLEEWRDQYGPAFCNNPF